MTIQVTFPLEQFISKYSVTYAFLTNFQLDGTRDLRSFWRSNLGCLRQVNMIIIIGETLNRDCEDLSAATAQVHGLYESLDELGLLTKTAFIMSDCDKIGTDDDSPLFAYVWRKIIRKLPYLSVSLGYDWGIKSSPKIQSLKPSVEPEEIQALRDQCIQSIREEQRRQNKEDLVINDPRDIIVLGGGSQGYCNKDHRLLIIPTFSEYWKNDYPSRYPWIGLIGQYRRTSSDYNEDWDLTFVSPYPQFTESS